jgi:hypothetical protein
VVVVELSLPAALLWERTRRVAFYAALAMHLGFEIVGRVDTIGWQMVALLVVFTAQPKRSTAGRGRRPAS